MFIQIESTPNPDALRFLLSTEIGTIGSGIEFSDANAAQGSTLARLLFEIQGVSKVFFGGDFVSVTKLPHVDWDALRPEILVVMTDYFSLHNAYSDSVPQAHEENDEQEFFDAKDSEVVQRVKELIEHYVRPAVAQDGGDIKFRGYKEGVVFVHLRGACSGCPSAAVTLKDGVYGMLSYYVPEVKAVESV
ncbi:NifU family protein [Anaplasma ovis str. Haibei]|uniref:NifU family protein n=1 Tax=Anaplasma ovis str. Haibei TaxID=1248439 RepID=A0A2Z2L9C2_9RICK|nr:NifU family protein [Anaplasma ovis]ASI48280.1 NifU family protein [Anaplasma ovis str. Haibei]